MSKYARPIAIGLAVGFVVSLLLSLLPDMGMIPVFMGTMLGVITAYSLANLAGNRKVAVADDSARAQALKLTPPEGKALVVVWREGFMGMAAGLNIAVDGREVAQLKSPRFTVIALSPGPHKVTAAFGGLAGPQNNPSAFDVEAAAGAVTVLKVGLKMGALKNTVAFTPQDSVADAQAQLARVPMVVAEAAP
jgi:hypothetical protein